MRCISIILFIIAFIVLPIVGVGVHAQGALTDIAELATDEPSFVRAYEAIELQKAWSALQGEAIGAVHIGVIDTGVDPSHPEFKDVQLGKPESITLFDSPVFVDTEDCFVDVPSHGTAVNGIIGANNLVDNPAAYQPGQMNGVLSGALDESQYILEQGALNRVLASADGFGPTEFDIRHEAEAVVNAGATVVNMSFSMTSKLHAPDYPCAASHSQFVESSIQWSDFFTQMANSSETEHVIFVVGAGNATADVQASTPPNIASLGSNPPQNIVVAGGIQIRPAEAEYVDRWILNTGVEGSNFGPGVHVSAPAADVYAPVADATGDFPSGGSLANYYKSNFGGTSSAAPFVTGVVGLMKALEPTYAQHQPPGWTLTPQLIKEILIKSADVLTTTDANEAGKTLGPVGGTNGCHYVDGVYEENPINGRGCRLNAHRAVTWLLPPSASEIQNIEVTPVN